MGALIDGFIWIKTDYLPLKERERWFRPRVRSSVEVRAYLHHPEPAPAESLRTGRDRLTTTAPKAKKGK